MLGISIDDDLDVLERAGRLLLRRRAWKRVLVTRGSRGMALFEPRQPTVHIPIFGSDEVTDVTGAGDTVIATCALALAAGASFYEAARLANYAGGLVVMKRGTATVSARELADAVTSDHDTVARELVAGRPASGTADVGLVSPATREARDASFPSEQLAETVARERARGARSRSPTAASTSCTSATSAICRRPPRKPIGWSSR